MVRLYLPKQRYNKEANEEKRKKKTSLQNLYNICKSPALVKEVSWIYGVWPNSKAKAVLSVKTRANQTSTQKRIQKYYEWVSCSKIFAANVSCLHWQNATRIKIMFVILPRLVN